MGSTGTGSFTDYPGSQEPKDNQNSSEANETGGSSGIDKCTTAFSTRLEDVASSDYFVTRGTVPAVGTRIQIESGSRIAATTVDGISLGYLPTRFNYLLNCMNSGFTYSGVISASNAHPLPSISIDAHPDE